MSDRAERRRNAKRKGKHYKKLSDDNTVVNKLNDRWEFRTEKDSPTAKLEQTIREADTKALAVFLDAFLMKNGGEPRVRKIMELKPSDAATASFQGTIRLVAAAVGNMFDETTLTKKRGG